MLNLLKPHDNIFSELEQFFLVLSNKSRTDILSMIYQKKVASLGDICRIFGLSKTTAMYHMKHLRIVGLLHIQICYKTRKKYYSVNTKKFNHMAHYLKQLQTGFSEN